MSAPRMKVTVLGSGTSTGVPIIGCRCPVCTSADPCDARLRCGFHVEAGGFGLQIDVSPDFRAQALRFAIGRVDALVVTHCHADHVLGLDDIRRFNTLQDSSIPVYARPAELRRVRRIFGYIFRPSARARRAHLYLPRLEPRPLGRGPVRIGPFLVRAIAIPHGPAKATAIEVALGARRAVFASDCSHVSPALAAMLRGADLAFLDGLRDRPHAAHLTLDAAAAALREARCRRARLIHIGHDVPHAEIARRYGPAVLPTFDGEAFEL